MTTTVTPLYSPECVGSRLVNNYAVISDSRVGVFERMVADYIENGWKLQGGVCVSNHMYYQAVTRQVSIEYHNGGENEKQRQKLDV